MDRKEYEDNVKKEWLAKNSHEAALLSKHITPFRPNLGYFIEVDGIAVGQLVFPEEFDVIREAYHSVLNKMEAHFNQLQKERRENNK
jgi:hypothetical protein